MNSNKIKISVPVMAEIFCETRKPEYLFWVGCAGAFDDRSKKVSAAFVKILNYCNIDFAVLGTEETCNGDPARRAGNEMLFQMQALTVIETFKRYEIKKIITTCPHCYNIFKNEYPELGGNYEVIHHSQFISKLIENGKLTVNSDTMNNKNITFHDPCYLGRANNEYDAPRKVVKSLNGKLIEMKRTKSFSFCCGAGGGQLFKEAEKGNKEIFIERIEEVIETNVDTLATACPFCMIMLTDGIKYKNKEDELRNYDIAELIVMANAW